MSDNKDLENAPAANAEGAEQAAVDTMPSLEELLRDAELKAVEHHDAWLRAKAETENIRRRGQEEVQKAQRYANDTFAKELLPVIDSLEAALATEAPSVVNLKEGVELTLRQLKAAFERVGVREVNPVGEKLDPNLHQAIGMVEADQEPNTVVTVLQKGFVMHDRTIRAAMVTVAKARA